MEDTIRQVLAKYGRLAIPVAELELDSDLFEAGMTSHASVTVMLGLENALDIEFPDELQRKSTFSTIGTIQSALTELGA